MHVHTTFYVHSRKSLEKLSETKNTCPYAKTELLNPARQFSTRGAPTSWKISICICTVNIRLFHVLSPNNQTQSTYQLSCKLACVELKSATESKVNVCPTIDRESAEFFWAINSPSSSSIFGGRIRTITYYKWQQKQKSKNILPFPYIDFLNISYNPRTFTLLLPLTNSLN